ncbi:MAG: lamin tail domain-containing protein [Saprospiraceae bacterium]|nr:lamin tail domain-containing protein [Saprospiraceae bacterium]
MSGIAYIWRSKPFYEIFTYRLLALIFTFMQAQVIISEYSSSNLRDFEDNFGEHDDWIELHNAGNNDVNIGGWYLSDKESKPKKWGIPQGTIIEAGGYLLFWASGRDVAVDGNFHTNFKFTQTNGDEFVIIANAAGTIIDKSAVELTAPQPLTRSKSGTRVDMVYLYPAHARLCQ